MNTNVRVFKMAIFLTLVGAICQAAIPQGYYQSTQGLSGGDLKNALHEIIDDHTEISYDDAYQALKILDRDPNDSNAVICLYTGFKMDAEKMYDSGNGWTREHVWPKSYGDFGTKKGAGTDLHHLKAVDASTNSNRSNRSFSVGGNQYIDKKGTYRGATDCKKGEGYGVWTWEPPENVRGDIARMVLYMVTRYQGDGEPDLELTEAIQKFTDKSPVLGVKSVILGWHFSDPVDDTERKRNDLIYENYQKNRNPYVDHDEFVERIWGNPNNPSAYSYSETASVAETEIPDSIEIGTYNLYWLGTEMRYRRGLREKEDVIKIADFVAGDLDLEIVVFQEVNTSIIGLFDGYKKMSNQQYKWLKKHMEDDGYKFIEGSSGKSQRIVIAYDSDEVSLISQAKELNVRDSFSLGSSCKSSGLRKPLAAQFKSYEFDFWVVGVHLKSQRGGDCSDRIRKEQVYDILEAVDVLVDDSSEPDVIILGDFNAKADDDSIDLLYKQGRFLTQTWSSRRSDRSGDISYLVGDFASLIDHIMIRPEYTSELVAKSTIVYEPDDLNDYIWGYSDHAPVLSSFVIEIDDD